MQTPELCYLFYLIRVCASTCNLDVSRIPQSTSCFATASKTHGLHILDDKDNFCDNLQILKALLLFPWYRKVHLTKKMDDGYESRPTA